MSNDTTPTSGQSSDLSERSTSSGSADASDADETAGSQQTPATGDTAESENAAGSGGADGTAGGAGSTAAPGRRKGKGFIRRHWILVSIAVVLALIVGSAGGYLYWIEHRLGNMARIESQTIENNEKFRDRDPNNPPPAEKNRALNILLLGADNGADSVSVEQELKDGTWTPFVHRSDTLMLVHIPADRKSIQLVSIPRDTWVKIDGYPYGEAHGKINAAFAFGGPDLAVKTVQQLTGITIDHLAIIDWAGFKDLTSAIGGVRVYIPETFYDDSQHITWHKGWQTLKGQEALAYVRTRHGLANGDFDRIERQQNFLRATMGQLLSKTHNIISMTKVINVITKYLTVDSTWSSNEILSLGWSLRNVHQDDVEFLTAPLGEYATSPDGQSIVELAPKQSKRLFRDVKTDDIADYLKRYPQDKLPGDHSVN